MVLNAEIIRYSQQLNSANYTKSWSRLAIAPDLITRPYQAHHVISTAEFGNRWQYLISSVGINWWPQWVDLQIWHSQLISTVKCNTCLQEMYITFDPSRRPLQIVATIQDDNWARYMISNIRLPHMIATTDFYVWYEQPNPKDKLHMFVTTYVNGWNQRFVLAAGLNK